MVIRPALPVLALSWLLLPRAAVAQEVAVVPTAMTQWQAPAVGDLFGLDANLSLIAQSIDQAADVFDAQLAEAILGELKTVAQARQAPGKQAPGQRLEALGGGAAAGPGWAALAGGHVDGGPVAIDWRQRLDGPAIAGKVGLSHADGPVEVRFDLESRVPLATPTATSVRYDSAAFVRVLPGLKLGAAASGRIDAREMRAREQAIGPEAKLSVPGLGGSIDAEAGWRMPVRDGDGALGGQPGVLKLGLSFRRPL